MSRLFSHRTAKSHSSLDSSGTGISKTSSLTTFRQLYNLGKYNDEDLLQNIQSFAKISKFQKLDYSTANSISTATSKSKSKTTISQPTVIKREMLMIECHHKVLSNESIDLLLLALEVFKIRIQNLVMSHCGLTDDTFMLLHQYILCLPNLQLLDLSQNLLTSKSVQAIHEYATHSHSNKLFTAMVSSMIILDLRQNHKYIHGPNKITSNITVEDGICLFHLFQETVEVLNGIEIQSVKENYQIQKVNYDNQKLFTESEIGILSALLIQENVTHIHELSLQNNHIDSALLYTLCTYLIPPKGKLPNLQRLDLSYNPLTSPKHSLIGIKRLVKQCQHNTSLIDIGLHGITPHQQQLVSSSSSSSVASTSITMQQPSITSGNIAASIDGSSQPLVPPSLTLLSTANQHHNQSQTSLKSTLLTISEDNDQESIAMSQTSAAVIAVSAITASIISSSTAGAVIPVIDDSILSAELMLKLHHSLAVNRSLSQTVASGTNNADSTTTVTSSEGRRLTNMSDNIAATIQKEKEYSDNRFASFLDQRFQQSLYNNYNNNNNNNKSNTIDINRYQTNITDTTKNHTIMGHSNHITDHSHSDGSTTIENANAVKQVEIEEMKKYTKSLFILDKKFCAANQLAMN